MVEAAAAKAAVEAAEVAAEATAAPERRRERRGSASDMALCWRPLPSTEKSGEEKASRSASGVMRLVANSARGGENDPLH